MEIKPPEKSIPLVGEGSPDFEKKADRDEIVATHTARKNAGVVQVSADFERDASPEARRARREESLRKEKGIDKNLERNLDGEIRAKYKIEVTFAGPDERMLYKGRSVQGPNRLGIQIWESGKRFHGGGDELMYWCQDNRPDTNRGCWAPIPGDCLGELAVCPACKLTWDPAYLTNMKIGNVTSQNLAKELAKIFHQLGSNADVYLKYHKTDIHYIAMEREKGPDVAKRLKGMHIYPLKNILKDTSAGADLAKRFLAFITS